MKNSLPHYGLNGSYGLNAGLNKAFSQTKVGGFFSRLSNRLSNLGRIGRLLHYAIEAVSFSLDVSGIEFRMSIEDVTPEEGIILENWDSQEFSPFIEKIVAEIKPYYDDGKPANIQIINAFLNRLNAVEAFHELAISNGRLSVNAVSQRNVYVREAIKSVRDSLTKIIEQQKIPVSEITAVKVSSSVLNVSPVRFSAPFTFKSTIYDNSIVTNPEFVEIIDDPLSPITLPVKNPPITIPDESTGSNPTDNTGSKPKNKSRNWLLLILAGYTGYRLLK